MSKITATIALLALASTSIADQLVSSPSTNFYFTVGGGFFSKGKTSKSSIYSQNQPIDIELEAINLKTTHDINIPSSDLSNKNKRMSQIFVGFGYKVFDKLRIEAVYIKPILFSSTHNFASLTSNAAIPYESGEIKLGVPFTNQLNYKANLTNKIDAVQARLYFDAFSLKDFAKFYLGAGIGLSKIDNLFEISGVGKSTHTRLKKTTTTEVKKSIGKKMQTSINYMLGAGVNLGLAEGITLGVGYEFQNFGTLKEYQNNLYKQGKITFKNHGVMLRLMYDI